MSVVLLMSAGLVSAHAAGTVTTQLGSSGAGANHSKLRNVAPKPDFFNVCSMRGYNNPKCIEQALAAIAHARSLQPGKTRPMVLPRNFRKLSVAKQTFVITNLERVDRSKRPVLGLTHPLNHRAHVAAVLHLDPLLPLPLMRLLHVLTWGSIWANDLGPLAADYDWMYNDGYSAAHGINLACVTPRSNGCWGHRRNILSGYHHQPLLLAGVGSAKPVWASIAEVISGGIGKARGLTFSWKTAVAHGANRHHSHH